MANKYLDQSGVQYLWSKIKSRDDITLQAAKKYVDDLLGMTDTDNAVVDKIAEVLEVFENYNEGKNLLDFINSKLDKAGGIISGDLTVQNALYVEKEIYAAGLFTSNGDDYVGKFLNTKLKDYLSKTLITGALGYTPVNPGEDVVFKGNVTIDKGNDFTVNTIFNRDHLDYVGSYITAFKNNDLPTILSRYATLNAPTFTNLEVSDGVIYSGGKYITDFYFPDDSNLNQTQIIATREWVGTLSITNDEIDNLTKAS